MKRVPLILICLLLIAILAAGCFSKTADQSPAELDESTGASPKESGENPPQSGTDENHEPISDAPETPVASGVSFIIDEPGEGQLVKSGSELTIRGKSRIREFDIEVEDGHEILGMAHVSVSGQSQELEEFEATIELKEHTSPSGMIIFVTEDEAGERQEELILPVKFE
ncbi:MAG: hypothetical protein WBJ82_06625 [Tepidanaerobacteraceae bacterium]|nr:hypothetical protein [Tepidanaerobacteraceae bacterium]HQE05491.1 hypothetical protein [Tepidanaerobacteraceae bacterium]